MRRCSRIAAICLGSSAAARFMSSVYVGLNCSGVLYCMGGGVLSLDKVVTVLFCPTLIRLSETIMSQHAPFRLLGLHCFRNQAQVIHLPACSEKAACGEEDNNSVGKRCEGTEGKGH